MPMQAHLDAPQMALKTFGVLEKSTTRTSYTWNHKKHLTC